MLEGPLTGDRGKDGWEAWCSGPFPHHNSLGAGDLQAGWEARRTPGEPAAPSAADGAERQRRPSAAAILPSRLGDEEHWAPTGSPGCYGWGHMSTANDRGAEKWFSPLIWKGSFVNTCMWIIFLQLNAAKKLDLKAPSQLLLGFGVKYGHQGLDRDYRAINHTNIKTSCSVEQLVCFLVNSNGLSWCSEWNTNLNINLSC